MNEERMYQVIRYPVISEKSNLVAERHQQFVFEVAPDATKSEIREAVRKIFNVRVLSVQVLNRKGKRKRFQNVMGQQSSRRTAYVRIHAEDDIDYSQNLGCMED